MKIVSPLPHKKGRLEIIPLIDIMFFLLASFMLVSLTMTKQHTVSVNLPAASAARTISSPMPLAWPTTPLAKSVWTNSLSPLSHYKRY